MTSWLQFVPGLFFGWPCYPGELRQCQLPKLLCGLGKAGGLGEGRFVWKDWSKHINNM